MITKENEKTIIMRFFAKWRRVCAEREGCHICPLDGKCHYGLAPEHLNEVRAGRLIDAVIAEFGGEAEQ